MRILISHALAHALGLMRASMDAYCLYAGHGHGHGYGYGHGYGHGHGHGHHHGHGHGHIHGLNAL